MHEQVEKSKGNKSRKVANSVAQKKSNGKRGDGFVDNRPETVAQRKIQALVNNYTIQKKINTPSNALNSVTQLVPDERHEYETVYDYFQNNHRGDINQGAITLLDNLHEYFGLGHDIDDNKNLISAIDTAVKNDGVMNSLKDRCIAIDGEGGTARWTHMAQHLKSGTSDELKEYDSFINRWVGGDGRGIKWAGIGTTLGIQSGMQAIMGNGLSSVAFAVRGILVETNLLITHAVHLSHKILYPRFYQGVLASVSALTEVAKFFETWTSDGVVPNKKSTKYVSNIIKKCRAGLMLIKRATTYFKGINFAPFDKYFNSTIGTLEAILNLCSLSDKEKTADIINNIVKLIRHMLGGVFDMFKHLIKVISDCCRGYDPVDVGSHRGMTL